MKVRRARHGFAKRKLGRARLGTAGLLAGFLAACLLVGVAPAGATGSAAPVLSVNPTVNPGGKLIRGMSSTVMATGLQSNTSYVFSSAEATFGGGLHSQTMPTGTVTPGSSQGVGFRLPATDPVDEFTITLTITGDPTVVASLDISVAVPYFTFLPGAKVCPGLVSTVQGHSFIEGSYALQSDSGTISPTPVQSKNGAFTSAITLNNDVTSQFALSATASGDSTPTTSQTLTVSPASVIASGFSDPWTGTVTGNCFAPGEQVDLSASGLLNVPASLTASDTGEISAAVTNRPDPQVDPPITLTATGRTSHQQAVSSVNSIARAALPSGGLLQGPGFGGMLASSTPGLQFEPNNCTAPLWQDVAGVRKVIWSALPVTGTDVGPAGCRLWLQPGGDLLLFSPTNLIIWTSNTYVAGSRLVLGDDGALRLISPAGSTVWSSAVVPSSVSVASSRVHSAVYINGLVQQRTPTGQLERGANRTVYLQRYLGGHWQNVLARVTDSKGQLAVGFIQNTVYQYRLVLAATITASGATSASTFR